MPIASLPQSILKTFRRHSLLVLMALPAWLVAPAAGATSGDLIFINGFNGCPTVYPDADGDFHGVPAGAIVSCTPPAGYALTSDDCDDTNAAVHPGAVDVPDTAYRDDNCDGIDGDIAGAVFVAPSGADTGSCLINAPCKSITFALSVAALDPKRNQVYVQAGTYDEAVALIAGKAIFGGYDLNWSRAARTVSGHIVTIRRGVMAGSLVGLSGPMVEGLVISSLNAMDAGASSSAVVIMNSSAIVLANVTVAAGSGAAGTSASPVDSVAAGDPGGSGNSGCENSAGFGCNTCTLPAGGPAGPSTCGHAGGAGGVPGLGPQVGQPGDGGFEGTLGGPGAPCSTCDGTVGANGAGGSAGPSGAGGLAFGSFTGTAYVPSPGADGTAGGPGQGGGGGGGGGGGTNLCDSYGSSGGGGGGGGCGGNPGQGGAGGGGSFGVILLDSSCTITNSSIMTSAGGTGGTGGTGSTGGSGGTPGPHGVYGGANEQDDGGNGADGGKGGDGGDGGHGGGGGGGPSIGVVCLGTSTLTLSGSNPTPGSGGLGGASSGTNGTDGLSAATHGCN